MGKGDDKETKTIGSRIKELSTLIGAICAIASILWIGFKEYNEYNSQKEDYPLLKQTVELQKKKIDSLSIVVRRLNAENILDEFQITVTQEVLSSEMEDYLYDGVRLKKSFNGKFYYYNNRILYKATWDQAAGKFFYTAEDGKTYWCN